MEWEYAIETVALTHRMRVMTDRGVHGWELVHYETEPGRCEMIFKRPAEPAPTSGAGGGR